MIEVLNENDRVGVLAISDSWRSPFYTKDCLLPNQIPNVRNLFNISEANEHNKELLYQFIDSLVKGIGKFLFLKLTVFFLQ